MNKSISKILEAFVDDDTKNIDEDEDAYCSLSYYQHTAQRIRYILATFECENNKFFGCIKFNDLSKLDESIIKNKKLLLELINTPCGNLLDYIKDNEIDWSDDDFCHIEEYLWFLKHTQNTVYYSSLINEDSRGHGNEYMTISKMLVVDKIKELKEELKFLQGITKEREDAKDL